MSATHALIRIQEQVNALVAKVEALEARLANMAPASDAAPAMSEADIRAELESFKDSVLSEAAAAPADE